MNKNKQPVIGVTMKLDAGVLVIPGIDFAIIRRDYGDALSKVGAAPIFLEPSIDPAVAAALCDGIVISGGEDIHPSVYGEDIRHTKLLEPTERSQWERRLVDACDSAGVPILGICYGSQLLNIHYGGTIYQDIAAEFGTDVSHGSSTEQVMHPVQFDASMLGYTKGQFIEVAARHHQAIKEPAEGFSVVARSHDGIIEAVQGRGHFGIQWHPESDDSALQIYRAFVQHCTDAQPVMLTDFLPEPA